jgi:hypothetical protein
VETYPMTEFNYRPPPLPPVNGPDTSAVTQSQVDQLQTEVLHAKQLVDEATQQLAKLRRQLSVLRLERAYFRTAEQLRIGVTHFFGSKIAGLVILGAAVGATCFIVTSFWAFGLVGVVVGTLGAACLLYIPADDKLAGCLALVRERLTALEKERMVVSQAVPRLEQNQQELSNKLAKWKALLEEERRRKSVENRRRNLLNANWKALRSVEFEQFLEQVFGELGYTVETTKVTGDQGGDLIVSKQGCRIAIQVKGYFNSVSNSAVQEAHTAKDYYGCHGSAVITNSRFTPSARDVARAVGCVLIGEDELPALILGTSDLCDMHRKAISNRPGIVRPFGDNTDNSQ